MVPAFNIYFQGVTTQPNNNMSANLSTLQWNDEDVMCYSSAGSSNVKIFNTSPAASPNNAFGTPNFSTSGPHNFSASDPVYLPGYPQPTFNHWIPPLVVPFQPCSLIAPIFSMPSTMSPNTQLYTALNQLQTNLPFACLNTSSTSTILDNSAQALLTTTTLISVSNIRDKASYLDFGTTNHFTPANSPGVQ